MDDSNSTIKNDCIHILLRGEKSQDINQIVGQDDYVEEFRRNNLCAIHVPILEFRYKNLDLLAELICEKRENSRLGLIITSPRVVTSLRNAIDSCGKSIELRNSLDEDYVFIVGERTATDWEEKTGLDFNRSSKQSGNGLELAKFIESFCPEDQNITLIYPKSSLADNKIEETIKQKTITVKSMEVYETRPVDDISSELLSALSNNLADLKNKTTVNFVMFSPSGVDGISRIDWKEFKGQVESILNHQVEFKFSSIGETTAAALRNKGIEVMLVASKPKPEALVKSILNCDVERCRK